MKPILVTIILGSNNMPGSAQQGKEEIHNFIRKYKTIRTIIDVGAGSATYPKLISDSTRRFVGVEIWSPYIEQFKLDQWYQKIVISDIRYLDWEKLIAEERNRFGVTGQTKEVCVIFGDVLEHIEKDNALEVLNKVLAYSDHVVVSIPVDGREGKIHFDNPNEAHISNWRFDELEVLAQWEQTLQSKGIGVFLK